MIAAGQGDEAAVGAQQGDLPSGWSRRQGRRVEGAARKDFGHLALVQGDRGEDHDRVAERTEVPADRSSAEVRAVEGVVEAEGTDPVRTRASIRPPQPEASPTSRAIDRM